MMIDTKELRIGNLVTYAGEPYPFYPIENSIVVVSEVLQDGVNLSQGDMTLYNHELLDGIAISSMWLERMGFTVTQYSGNADIWKIVDDEGVNKNNYAISMTFNLFHSVNGAGDAEYIFGKEIKFVHQLQNLHFALTGEELKINE